jgi:Na+/proline symporter
LRSIIFRLLAGLIGFGIIVVVVTVPPVRHPSDGFWPDWIYVLSFLTTAAVFLIYAITGHAWPRSYGEKIGRKSDKLNDR